MRDRTEVLELAVLGRLADGPLHGYELRKRLVTDLGVFRTLSFGSLYPRLRSLADRGLVTASGTAELPHPLAGRRSRVVYELTPEGKEHLAAALAVAEPTAWEDDAFDVRFSLFAATEPSTRLHILEGRRTRVLERREAYRLASARGRERRDAYTLELQRHGLELLDRELGWLDGLIASERAGSERTGSERATPNPSTPPAAAPSSDGTT
ncbi:MAG TPA: PadR family transcriptional regulator [Micrococcales bacterium]|uniref:PadR family transcriptional regulator n=1 Tax=Miniimonas arenae TaxID=676201 RepID=A0A5C5BAE0_9MICO|nr:PadR family transcriptional regulator [Miniimonas arenae]TNU73484.1 PadR family transcriptional regulator [Miniimonas arenae]HCX86229.1 PadR family transcriptional regulator [Micrococcales bacterium]